MSAYWPGGVRHVDDASPVCAFRAERGVDPETGHHWDDTKRYIEAADLPDEDRRAILEANALRIYPRLAWHAVRSPANGLTRADQAAR